MGPSTGTQAFPHGHPAGGEQLAFWIILLALGWSAEGHTKVLLTEPTFELCDLGLRHPPLWVPTICNWE